MANWPKQFQAKMGQGATAGTRNQARSQRNWLGQLGHDGGWAGTTGQSPAWGSVGSSLSQSQQAGNAPAVETVPRPQVYLPAGTVQGMGPYVPGGGTPNTASTWAGGPLGAVPNHHGWSGLQDVAKTWTLRLLGAFPDLRFSSGYRTPAQNAAAGGVPNSGHMQGWKVDISGNHKRLAEAAAWAKRHGARILLHDAGSGYHLDISWRGLGV